MSSEIRHIGIVVNNLEENIDFWKNFFSFEIVVDQIEPTPYIDKLLNLHVGSLRTVKIKGGSKTIIELLKFHNLTADHNWQGQLTSTGLTHIAITVTDIEGLYKRLKETGYTPLSEILTPPNNEVKVVFIRGPENLILELVQENI